MMGPMGGSETSAKDYHSTQRNIPGTADLLLIVGRKQSLVRLRRRWYDVIRMDHREANRKGGYWTGLD
jgi:hypothetical protein